MKTKLVIVESPAKAGTIARFLGPEYRIAASVGHIRDLPSSLLGVDVKRDFKPRYVTMKGKEKVVRELKELASNASEVYIATDPDREGEAIAWHIESILKIPEDSNVRITFNEITKKVVQNAIENPRKINKDLVNSQQCRRILDRLVGYELSPFLWKKVRKGLSAGRVQSVATRIIVEREREIQAFQPEEYWHLFAELQTEKQELFTAKYHGERQSNNKVKVQKLENEAQTLEIVNDLKQQDFVVASVNRSEKKRYPLPPFTTSTLQQEASRRLGFSSARCMRVAQQLYEGIDLKDQGRTALLTYIRTDSVRISQEAIEASRDLIYKTYGSNYLPDKPRFFKNKNASQDAHEALRPSHFELSPESVAHSLTSEQFRLYKLIWDRFLASQMTPAVLDTLQVDVDAGSHVFRTSGEAIKFSGFLVLYGDFQENNSDANESKASKSEDKENNPNKGINIPNLETNEQLSLKKFDPQQKFTKPPARFSEASLIKKMEELGIGRPSTYAPTISTILSRRYVEKDKKQLLPTDLGCVVTDLLSETFNEIVDTDFTAKVESDLDAIESGERDWIAVLNDFYPPFHSAVEEAIKSVEKVKLPTQDIGEKCPQCENGNLQIKEGRYGKFIACDCFPECNYTRALEEKLDAHCPLCAGQILQKKSRRGSLFYVCDKKNDPNCAFISWDLPIDGKFCETCGAYMVQKRFRGRNFIRCSNQACETNAKTKKKAKTTKKKTEDNLDTESSTPSSEENSNVS